MKHLEMLTRYGAVLDGGAVSSFGDPAAEHAAVRLRAGVFDLTDRDRVAVRGADAPAFLHRLVTVAIDRMPVGGGGRAFLLSSTGKIQAAFHLLRIAEDDFWVEMAAGVGGRFAESLDFYLFGERVEIQPLRERWSLLSVQGPGAADVLRRLELHPPAALWSHEPARLVGVDVRVARIDRTGTDGFDVWAPRGACGAVFEALADAGAHPAGGRALESLRVEAGLPAWGHEYAEGVIPLEVSGMEGITDRKGCYPGQEVVERLISLGRPPRQLVALTLAADAAVGAEVTAGDDVVGQLTSVAALPDGTRAALALVKRRAAESNEALAVAGALATRRAPRTGAR